MPVSSKALLKDAATAIAALRDYIQAIPDDVVATLPTMPGVDGNWLAGRSSSIWLQTGGLTMSVAFSFQATDSPITGHHILNYAKQKTTTGPIGYSWF